MSKIKLFHIKLWIIILYPIWSFIINSLYWLFHIHQLKKVLVIKKNKLRSSVHSIKDVKKIMSNFKWTKDNFKDWTPWLITIINRDLKDDCDGAAILGKWLLKQINIKSSIYYLYGKNCGHAICISSDKSLFISNHQVLYLTKINWKHKILKRFDYKYNQIVKGCL